jgi:hypothetical protein
MKQLNSTYAWVVIVDSKCTNKKFLVGSGTASFIKVSFRNFCYSQLANSVTQIKECNM